MIGNCTLFFVCIPFWRKNVSNNSFVGAVIMIILYCVGQESIKYCMKTYAQLLLRVNTTITSKLLAVTVFWRISVFEKH